MSREQRKTRYKPVSSSRSVKANSTTVDIMTDISEVNAEQVKRNVAAPTFRHVFRRWGPPERGGRTK